MTSIFSIFSYFFLVLIAAPKEMEVINVTFSFPIAIAVLASLLLFKLTFGLYSPNLFEEIKIDVTLLLFGLMQYLIIYSIV